MARDDQVFHLRDGEADYFFAQAVRSHHWLFVSGTTSLDRDGNLVAPGDLSGQLEQTYRNIAETLAAHDLGFDAVVKETIFTTDAVGLLGAVAVRRAAYGDVAPPAASWVEVRRLMRPEHLVEIEVIAELPSRPV